MSLKETKSTTNWKNIPRKCKNCDRAIYTIEDGKVYYQCNLYGSFNKNCEIKINIRSLLKPSEINK